DASAHLKWLGSHGHATTVQHAVDITGAMPRCQHDHGSSKVAGGGNQPTDGAAAQIEVFDPAGKTELPAQTLDAPAKGLDYGRQPIATQMGTILVQDRWLALANGKQFKDAANIRSRATAGQLAVAERAGAPFAEEIVAFRIERSAGVESMDIMN